MLHYVTGDATQPGGSNKKIIAHVVNDIGAWGAGFVVAISNRWKEPETAYRRWKAIVRSTDIGGEHFEAFALGNNQYIPVEPDICVANMCAQHGLRTSEDGIPLRYDALRICLEKVAYRASQEWASVHMPRIGCGLAGGSWPEVEGIILDTLVSSGLEVYVYDLPS